MYVHGGPINNTTTIKDMTDNMSLTHVNRQFSEALSSTPIAYITQLYKLQFDALKALTDRKYDNPSLMQFISTSAPNHCVNSIITGPMDVTNKTIDHDIYQWLLKGGIDTIVRGHQPIGQVAMVQQLSPNNNNKTSYVANDPITVVHLDTSFSNRDTDSNPYKPRTWYSIAQLNSNRIKLHAYGLDPADLKPIEHYTWRSDQHQPISIKKDQSGMQTYCMSYRCENCKVVGEYSFCMTKQAHEQYYKPVPKSKVKEPIRCKCIRNSCVCNNKYYVSITPLRDFIK